MKVDDCNRCILLFARYPEKGRVKTRLETHLAQDRILSLYRCFVEDILATLKKSGYPVHICFLPENRGAKMEAWLGPASAFVPQKGEHLGQRMCNAFVKAFNTKAQPIDQAILLGSDLPDLDPKIFDQAFDSLSQNDVTLGPAVDDGYYLIGFNRHTFFKDVFTGISWGTGQVFTQTMEKIEHAGLKVHILPEWRDIDTFEDLKIFYDKAQRSGLSDSRTLTYLEKILHDV